jgi:ABC-2 type transport system ATP-binding protein
MIEVRGLSKRFGATVAVDQVSFTVEKGEVLGFLGPNGAGKTTTMRILTGFLPPDAGTATVAGYDILGHSLEARRRLGYLPESSPLYLDLTVYEYLDYVARIRGIRSADRSRCLRRTVELCGLGGKLDQEIGSLSKGYRQRVGLAQTLIHEPEILILDEPTTGLDPNQIAEIRDLIRTIGRERTVLLSTHILSEVEATCGRVIIIDDGKVVASGTPGELSARAHGGTHFLVSVRAPEAEALRRLGGLPGVRAARSEGSGDGLARLRLDCDDGGADLGEAIFRAVVAAGWSLTELRREAATLEHVFHQLTTRETGS